MTNINPIDAPATLTIMDIKIGESFKMHQKGQVLVRCKGGFRNSRSEQVWTCDGQMQLFRHVEAVA